MNKKIIVSISALVVIIAVSFIVKNNEGKIQNTEPVAMNENKTENEKPDESKMMMAMDESAILGVVLKDGKVMSVWPGNELMELDGDLILSNGTKVSKESGMIVSTSGSKIVLKEGQLLSQDGKLSPVDISKMKVMENHNNSMMMDETVKMDGAAGKQMERSGSYVDYSTSVVANESSMGKKVVLFFHAPWCPFCREADAAFKSNTSQIPSGVTVVKTDYDSNAELKKKYAVTTQHTFVQVDGNGNMITKWIGGDIANLQKYTK